MSAIGHIFVAEVERLTGRIEQRTTRAVGSGLEERVVQAFGIQQRRRPHGSVRIHGNAKLRRQVLCAARAGRHVPALFDLLFEEVELAHRELSAQRRDRLRRGLWFRRLLRRLILRQRLRREVFEQRVEGEVLPLLRRQRFGGCGGWGATSGFGGCCFSGTWTSAGFGIGGGGGADFACCGCGGVGFGCSAWTTLGGAFGFGGVKVFMVASVFGPIFTTSTTNGCSSSI